MTTTNQTTEADLDFDDVQNLVKAVNHYVDMCLEKTYEHHWSDKHWERQGIIFRELKSKLETMGVDLLRRM